MIKENLSSITQGKTQKKIIIMITPKVKKKRIEKQKSFILAVLETRALKSNLVTLLTQYLSYFFHNFRHDML